MHSRVETPPPVAPGLTVPEPFHATSLDSTPALVIVVPPTENTFVADAGAVGLSAADFDDPAKHPVDPESPDAAYVVMPLALSVLNTVW